MKYKYVGLIFAAICVLGLAYVQFLRLRPQVSQPVESISDLKDRLIQKEIDINLAAIQSLVVSDERLKERFQKADVVVAAHVGYVGKYLLLPTEQKADWHVAYIHIYQVLKGHFPKDQNSYNVPQIFFPGSWEVESVNIPGYGYWWATPKFSGQQNGIFALRYADKGLDLYKYDSNALTALDVDDFQPLSELQRILKILAVR